MPKHEASVRRHRHKHHNHQSEDRRRQYQILSQPVTATSTTIPNLPFPIEYPTLGWCRQRSQLLDLELQELRLFVQAADLIPEWYQDTTYFVAFHPTSEPIQTMRFPDEVSENTVQGQHAVSHAVAALEARITDAGEQGVIVQFQELLTLAMDYLHDNIAVYIWGRKAYNYWVSEISKIARQQHEEFVLIGHCICSLNDFSLQGRAAVWSILNAGCRECGELVLNYRVVTTPGPVQNAAAADVSQLEAVLQWRAPLNDYGAPVYAYKVDLLEEDRKGRPLWVPMFETASLHVVADGLQPGTFYVFRVRAVNRVGAGDPCEFSFTTLPMPQGFGQANHQLGQTQHVHSHPAALRERGHHKRAGCC